MAGPARLRIRKASCARRGRQLRGTMVARSPDETREERMAVARSRAELGVILARDEERMVRQLDDLDEPVAREAREAQPGIHQPLQVIVVELEAVAVPLPDRVSAVYRVRKRAVGDAHFLRSKAHRATEVGLLGAGLDRALLVL